MYTVEQLTKAEPVNYKMIITNLGKQDVSGTEAYSMKLHDGSLFHYMETEEGIARIAVTDADGTLTKDSDMLFRFRYPLTEGTTWETPGVPFLMQKSIDEINDLQNSMPALSLTTPLTMTYKIDSLNARVEVPAGKYRQCMKVTGTGSCTFSSVGSFARQIIIDVINTDWYCPETGLVKTVREEVSRRIVLDPVKYSVELEHISI
ncbi:MAG: hypothetical protein MI673_08910 [Thiotrichales bacterium]|nr:hypothetical protein [Thiotrichales bacterium]